MRRVFSPENDAITQKLLKDAYEKGQKVQLEERYVFQLVCQYTDMMQVQAYTGLKDLLQPHKKTPLSALFLFLQDIPELKSNAPNWSFMAVQQVSYWQAGLRLSHDVIEHMLNKRRVSTGQREALLDLHTQISTVRPYVNALWNQVAHNLTQKLKHPYSGSTITPDQLNDTFEQLCEEFAYYEDQAAEYSI